MSPLFIFCPTAKLSRTMVLWVMGLHLTLTPASAYGLHLVQDDVLPLCRRILHAADILGHISLNAFFIRVVLCQCAYAQSKPSYGN